MFKQDEQEDIQPQKKKKTALNVKGEHRFS